MEEDMLENENDYTFDPTQYSFGTGGVSGFYETLATDHLANNVGLGAGYIPGFEENISGSVTLLKLANGAVTFEELTPQQQQSVLTSAEGYLDSTSADSSENDYTVGGNTIVAGEPANASEVNIVDYTGRQAVSPEVQPYAKVLDQLKSLGLSDDEIIEFKEKYKLDTDTGTIAYSPLTSGSIDDPVLAETETIGTEQVDVTDKPALVEYEADKVFDKVDKIAEGFKAATLDLDDIDPRAIVVEQMTVLQEQLADGKLPPWASESYRNVVGMMAARGMGNSSLAAEAIINGLLTSTQELAVANTAFYQTITTQNLENEQEVEVSKFTNRVEALFKDQAAENLARNTNTLAENSLNQFYATLTQDAAKVNAELVNFSNSFNATATNQANQALAELQITVDSENMTAVNDMAQFDAELTSKIGMFHQEQKTIREKYNIDNQLAIDASNIKWKRDINTSNTAAYNAALEFDVKTALDIQSDALANIWAHYDSVLDFTFKAEENGRDRAFQFALQTMKEELALRLSESEGDTDLISGIFSAGARFLGTETGAKILEGWFSS